MSYKEKDAIERRDEAIELLNKKDKCIGFSEKDWLIDQIAQTLLGPEYEQWVEEYEKNGKAIAVRTWEKGTEPTEKENAKLFQIHTNHPEIPLIIAGDIWINKNNGKEVVIIETPTTPYQKVRLKHASGLVTEKGQHYFAYDYRKKGE